MNKKPHNLIAELESDLISAANHELAIPMAGYMKNYFLFLGIKQPERKKLASQFLKKAGLLDNKEILDIADALWEKKEREFQYIALELLYNSRKKWDNNFLPFFLGLVTRKPWWDTVDFIATKLIGDSLAQVTEPEEMKRFTASADLWENRTAILFQLNYKEKTDARFLYRIIRRLLHKKEFFIQKAIGWSLRQYYRTDPKSVEHFVDSAGIYGLAKREALKHAREDKNT